MAENRIFELEPGTRVRVLLVDGHTSEVEGSVLRIRFGLPPDLVNPCWHYPVLLAGRQEFLHIPAEDQTNWRVA